MSQEFQFYSVMDSTEYAGKWVAIVGNKVIASGDDLKEVYKKAKEKSGSKEPLFVRIPDKEETLILWPLLGSRFRADKPNGALTFEYIKDNHKGKIVHPPRVEIRLSNGDKSFKIAMLVDSGVDVTLIPLEIAQILELDLNSNDMIESSSASGKFQTIGREVNAELIKGTKTFDFRKGLKKAFFRR